MQCLNSYVAYVLLCKCFRNTWFTRYDSQNHFRCLLQSTKNSNELSERVVHIFAGTRVVEGGQEAKEDAFIEKSASSIYPSIGPVVEICFANGRRQTIIALLPSSHSDTDTLLRICILRYNNSTVVLSFLKNDLS